MQEFNFSSFLNFLHGCIPSLKQGPLGILVLESIATRDEVQINVDDKKVSNLVNQRIEIDDAIKVSSNNNQTISDTVAYFQNNICPLLNLHSKDDCFKKILKCLTNDPSVPYKKITELTEYLNHNDEASFLAFAFLYAINRPNKLTNTPPSTDDFPLLEEVHNKCPICGKNLVKNHNGKTLRMYEIVKIFPDDIDEDLKHIFTYKIAPPKNLNSPLNQIPLCIEHARKYYQFPDIDSYFDLSVIKKEALKFQKSQETLFEVGLEIQIKEVIDALENNAPSTSDLTLNMDALKIDQKILPEFHLLKNNIQSSVLTYFNYIQELFAEIPDYQLIQLDIKKAFLKLNQGELTQPEIVEQLSKWIIDKTHMSTSHQVASNIIVAYFIQNCEVFHEISK